MKRGVFGFVACLIFGLLLNTQLAPSVRAGILNVTGNSFIPSHAISIAAGIYHACAVTNDGMTKCWGDNRDGQLGDGTTAERHVPTLVSGLDGGIATVTAGGYFTCALMVSGGVKCWGQNSSGQLGDGTTTYRYTPVDVLGLTNQVNFLTTGGFHACALMNGGVQCWGENSSGQIGDNTTIDRNLPVQVNGLSSGISNVSTGIAHTCAVTTSGGVKCWGDNSYGQLGDGTTNDHSTPVDVIGLVGIAVSVSAGDSYTCVLMAAGGVKCWGLLLNGQIFTPIDVDGLQSGVNSLAAGLGYTCALMTSGTVKCWGVNSFGQLGDGTTSNRATPIDVIGLSNVSAIAAGDGHTCAIIGNGVRCWGRNFYGELGSNEFLYRTIPVSVAGVNPILAISAGWLHACILTNNLGVQCWGYNGAGQLGDGTTTDHAIPKDVNGLISGITSIANGQSLSCAVTNGGGAKCWGSNSSGQLGDGTNTDRTMPVGVLGLNSNVNMIVTGSSHACALQSGGVKCWGNNAYGQLGNGSTLNSIVPISVVGLTSGVTKITAGDNHTCAIINGGVKCWGNNASGQLGDGTTTNQLVPANNVSGLDGNVTSISAGASYTCAVIVGGGAKCWGANWTGQLGDGTTNNQKTPVDVIGLTNGTLDISAGGFITCALTLSGGVKCWGFNGNGAVGDGTIITRYSPVDVIGLTSNATLIAVGQNFACALMNGAGKCWGFNYYGQLGNGEAGHHATSVGALLYRLYFPFFPKN